MKYAHLSLNIKNFGIVYGLECGFEMSWLKIHVSSLVLLLSDELMLC